MEKTPVMLAYCGLCRILCLWACIAFISTCVPGGAAAAQTRSPIYEATVVLDPGHGGLDTGAKGAEGVLEKTVALTLAQKVAAVLEADHRVLLTRTGDYGLDLPGRTAVANGAKADLFISIHTGGGFLHQAKGLYVFYFKDLPTVSEPKKEPSHAGNLKNWDFLQYRHLSASSRLAGEMARHLGAGNTFTVNGIETAPLMVLRGADMPAIVVEVGYLTYPLEGKMLQDPEVLADLAARIGAAISSFLRKP
jgi:N-acetylmuramoyl-L-alanine amidase